LNFVHFFKLWVEDPFIILDSEDEEAAVTHLTGFHSKQVMRVSTLDPVVDFTSSSIPDSALFSLRNDHRRAQGVLSD
jgi:hypothetical protein